MFKKDLSNFLGWLRRLSLFCNCTNYCNCTAMPRTSSLALLYKCMHISMIFDLNRKNFRDPRILKDRIDNLGKLRKTFDCRAINRELKLLFQQVLLTVTKRRLFCLSVSWVSLLSNS